MKAANRRDKKPTSANNHFVKRFDKIILSAVFILLTGFWLNYLVNDLVSAMFISFLIWIVVKTIGRHISARLNRTKHISVSETEFCFALMGTEKACAHFLKLFPESNGAAIENSSFISYTKDGKKMLLLPHIKFSPPSAEDIAKAWRYANENGFKKITVLSKQVNRSLLFMSRRLNVEFEFVEMRRLQKFLIKHNALPDKKFYEAVKEKKDRKAFFKSLLTGIFNGKRAKMFILSGTALAVMSFFTPLKIYYLTLASISFIFAAVCYWREYVR